MHLTSKQQYTLPVLIQFYKHWLKPINSESVASILFKKMNLKKSIYFKCSNNVAKWKLINCIKSDPQNAGQIPILIHG